MVVTMNIHKRFIVQFLIQLALGFTLFILIILILWAIIGFTVMNEEVTQDLSEANSYFISDNISIKDEKVTFDNKLKKLAKNQNGWFLVLAMNGDVIGSYNAPEQAPTHFKESELAGLLLQNSSNSIQYTLWKVDETHPQPILILYGREDSTSMILNEVKSDVDWTRNKLTLSANTLQQLEKEDAWVQLINSNGKVIDSFGTNNQPDAYLFQELVILSENAHDSVSAYFDTETEQTIMVGTHVTDTTLQENIFKSINNKLVIFFIVLFLLLLIGTFWYARKFAIPLITIMKWIQNLGDGLYEHPNDLYRRPIMYNKKEKLKRKYRLYKDLVTTLIQLTKTLQQNEARQKKMTQTREEWISGLSHDLKTPLSSITGFAQMLESEDYVWTKKETREFASIITEKSSYMMTLLDDLTLSYRINNDDLPIIKEEIDINEFIRRTIIHFINDSANHNIEFIFEPHNEIVLASIDPKWFQRVLDNLLANAIKYNPPGTTIKVTIAPIEKHLVTITIEDDGIGMDKETLDKLFQRYYRGTNTNDSGIGTGLGLAITKQLIQLLGGSINVKSVLRKGTTVRIMIPN